MWVTGPFVLMMGRSQHQTEASQVPELFAMEISKLLRQETDQVFAGRHWLFTREQRFPLLDNRQHIYRLFRLTD
jgi:hypothetical protein